MRAHLRIALCAAVLVNVVLLSPMLACGYTGDDLMTSCSRGFAAEQHVSVFQFTLMQIGDWVKAHGRFFPLALHCLLFFDLVRSLLAYRLIGLLFNLGNVLLFAHLVTRLTGSKRLGVLVVLVAPLSFQFRFAHDSILSFCLMMQLTWGFLLGSLLLLDRHLQERRPWKLRLSVLCYALAVLTYEVAWPFFVLHYVLIRLRASPKDSSAPARRTACPFVAAAAAFVVLTLVLHALFHVPMVKQDLNQDRNPYRMNLTAESILTNLGKQEVAALPLSYHTLALGGASQKQPVPTGMALILAAGFLAATALVLRQAPSPALPAPVSSCVRRVNSGGMLVFGVAIMLLPAALISLSGEHLRDAAWGVAYIPVYISYFGTTLLLITGIAGLIRLLAVSGRFRQPLYCVLLIGLGGTLATAAVVEYQDNCWVVEEPFNWRYLHPREVIQDALRDGLFAGKTDGLQLWLANLHRWEEDDVVLPFFRTYSGLHIHVLSSGKTMSGMTHDKALAEKKAANQGAFQVTYSPGEDVYYLNYAARYKQSGFAALSQITSLSGNRVGLLEGRAINVRLYLRLKSRHAHVVVHGSRPAARAGDPEKKFAYDSAILKQLAHGRYWCLVELPMEAGDIDPLSLRVTGPE